jgi:molecular chaperone DnaJ
MANKRDFYEVLGVAREADADTIKKAYRKLAMQYHPDKNPGNAEAEEMFKEAAAAYEVLSDASKRAQYDRFGHSAFSQGGGGQGYSDVEDIFSNFGDIFGDLFGMGGGQRGRGRSGPRRGADLRYISEISLKEVVEGAEQDIQFDTEENCTDCNGNGAEKGSTPEVCGTCRGSGQVVRSQGFFQMASTCPTCQGRGSVIKKPCKPCRGSGRRSQHRKIRLTIPPGVDNGTRLRVSNEGEGGYQGGQPGDLYVEIRVKNHESFERRGEDLLGEVTLSYLQALLGADIEVPTVTGKAKLTIPKGVQVGETIKLPNEGVPSLRDKRRGDLYFTVHVEFPKKISKEEEKLLREIAQIRGEKLDDGGGLSGLFGRSKK